MSGNHQDRKHAKLSASGSNRWMNCPGSIRLCEDIPQKQSDYADLGTAAHELAEKCLLENKNPSEFMGMKMPVNGKDYIVDDEMAEAVQVYVDTIRADQEEMGEDAELIVEKRFHLDWLHEDMFGTNDAALSLTFEKLTIYDYKHGAGVAVDVAENTQLMYYAIGAMHGEIYEEVELVVIQPRANHPDGPVRRWKTTPEELMKWAEGKLLPAAEATDEPDAPLVAGYWCKKTFCPAFATCPAARKLAVSQLDMFVDGNNVPVVPQRKMKPPEELSKHDLSKLMKMADYIEAYIKEVRALAYSKLDRGEEVPGFKLVQGRKSRKWKDEGEAKRKLSGYKGAIYKEMEIKTPAQMEKMIKQAGSKPDDVLKGLIDESYGKPSMVTLDNKKPAINKNKQDVLDDMAKTLNEKE